MIDFRQYHFSIIYSLDVDAKTRLANYRPPNFQKNGWQVTEDDPTEMDDVFGKNGKHRKYCGILDFPQFLEFIDHCGITAERTQTGGSLGAPCFGIGWSPAVCFDSDDQDAWQQAYVTPIPPEMWAEMMGKQTQANLPGMPEDVRDLDWPAIEQTMWDWFDDGKWSAVDKVKEIENAQSVACN